MATRARPATRAVRAEWVRPIEILVRERSNEISIPAMPARWVRSRTFRKSSMVLRILVIKSLSQVRRNR